MTGSLWSRRELLVVAAAPLALRGQTALTREQKEAFLLKAKVLNFRSTARGITNSLHATLSDGTLTHDAHIQTIDEAKSVFQTPMGSEINFRDTWKFNLAAYQLDHYLGLNMVPVSVERSHAGKTGSFTWWVENVQFDELDRKKRKIEPPDNDAWNKQMHIVRVFDQLIANTDRNLGNLLIDKDWRIWMIDHTRGFRLREDLLEPKNLQMCDRELYAKLKSMTQEDLAGIMKKWLNNSETKALLKRRDKIIAMFDKMGPAVMYDCPRRES
jgi:hypothetical protein